MRAEESIRTLNHLIRSCRSAEAVCRACADTRGALALRSVLRHRSDEWGRYGDELQALVLMLGGEPATGGAASAWGRRMWLLIKGLLLGSSEALVLDEWRFEQQWALNRYDEALRGYLSRRVRRTVTVQSVRILQRLEQIESLRREYFMAAPNASRV